MNVSTDYSNGAKNILIIRKTEKKNIHETTFAATDERSIADFVECQMGDMLHTLTGCPIYMELSGWSYNNAGIEADYSLYDHYEGLEDGWEVELTTRD